jgi:hypothetical protein
MEAPAVPQAIACRSKLSRLGNLCKYNRMLHTATPSAGAAKVLPVCFGQVRKIRTAQGVFVRQQHIWRGMNFPWRGPQHVVDELQTEGQCWGRLLRVNGNSEQTNGTPERLVKV